MNVQGRRRSHASPLSILIAYHGSHAAQHAVEVTAALFPSCRVTVAYLRPAPTRVARHLLVGDFSLLGNVVARDRETSVAEEGAELARRHGLIAWPLVHEVRFSVSGDLADLAGELDVDLIVVGKRGRRHWYRGAISDFAKQLASVSWTPVLVIRAEEP